MMFSISISLSVIMFILLREDFQNIVWPSNMARPRTMDFHGTISMMLTCVESCLTYLRKPQKEAGSLFNESAHLF